MGKNQKQANRTKNNTKPSSSSRSAEKLGTNLPGFVGFSANLDGGYTTVLPGFSSNDAFDAKLDPNAQLIFRKMCKKDPVTKLKALNEFWSLVKFSEEAALLEMLSFWPRLYAQLASDCNHRVREAAQLSHGALVEKVGRNMAPYLKQTVPTWITSQYDIYGPAKTKARESFQNAFPKGKVSEVMSFCRNEILSFITDNLTTQTALTLSNPKIFTPEECESIYERTIITSLQGYEFFIRNLPESSLEWLCENQTKTLDNAKFWELGKSKVPPIRSSFYAVIGSLAQRLTRWFEPKYGEKACKLIFGKLCEVDIDAIVSILENSVLLMTHIQDWCKFTPDVDKVLSCISTILSNGGWNNAFRIGPLLVPLLTQLLNIPNNNTALIYDDFISSVCRGLEQRSIILSKTAYDAWLNGLVECLEYVACEKIHIDDDTKKLNIITLSKAVRTWFSTIMRPKIANSTFDYVKLNIFYLSKISFSWTRQSIHGTNKSTFCQLIRVFWQNLQFLITSQLDSAAENENELTKCTNLHVELLIGLKNNNGGNIKAKKVSRVKFDIDHDDKLVSGDENIEDKIENVQSSNECPVNKDYQLSLNKTVYDICGHYFTYAIEKKLSSPILNPLYSLMREFDSRHLHTTLLSASKNSLPLVNLHQCFYLPWLTGDSMRSQVVVDLTFVLFNYLDNTEQASVLKSFDQLSLPVVKWCISRCISYPFFNNPIIREWLLSETVHQSLIALCKLIIKEGDKHHMDLVKMCFVQNGNEGLLLSRRTCFEIIMIFVDSLINYESEHLNMCVLFTCYLLSANHIMLDSDQELQCKLLTGLFKFDCNTQKINDTVPEDTLREVSSSWQDSLCSLPISKLCDFINCAGDIIHEKIIENNDISQHLEVIDKLVDLSHSLVFTCLKTDVHDNAQLIKIFPLILKNRFVNANEYMKEIEMYSLVADILKGNFTCALTIDSPSARKSIENCVNEERLILNKDELLQSFSWILYSVKLIEKIIVQLYGSSIDSNVEDVQYNIDGSELYKEIKNSWIDTLYSITILKTLFREYKMMSWYDILLKFYTPIELALINTIKHISKQQFEDINSDFECRAENEGEMYWSSCRSMCDSISSSSDVDISTLLTCEIDNIASMFYSNEDVKELLGSKLCYKLQIVINENSQLDAKLKLTISGILALRQVYFNNFVMAPTEKSFINSEELKNILVSPVAILSLIDGHFPLKELLKSDCDLKLKKWENIHCIVSVVKFLSICISEYGWELQVKEWDFITITLVSLLQSVTEAKDNLDNLKVSAVTCAVLELFYSLSRFVSSILPESVRREPTPTILQLLDEWRDLVSPAVHSYIIELFMKICSDGVEQNAISPVRIFVINSLCVSMEAFDWKHIESNNTQYSLDNVLQSCLHVMASPSHHVFKYLANVVLKLLTPSMINTDKMASNKNNASEIETASTSTEIPVNPEKLVLSVHTIDPTLTLLQNCMEAVLSPYKIGDDHCVLVPYTDSHSIALGYLLVWEVLLDIAQESTAYLQHEYSEFFKDGQFVDRLMNVLFRLLPDELANLSASPVTSNIFNNSPKLNCEAPITWELINTLACHRLLRCLQGGWLAALVRGWWGSLPSRTAHYVEQIIRTHVSPLLIANQLAIVSKKQGNIPNIEIGIHSSVNEVACIYVIEDLKMGLTIQLCNNHPLNKPHVVSSGTPLNNMAWLSMYLSHQNGSVYQAIRMWANAVQKKVESTPVCYVCYCRLHPNNGQLPKMLCQTCKNKFHNVCLYKWFSTSGKATCPMCRNVFAL